MCVTKNKTEQVAFSRAAVSLSVKLNPGYVNTYLMGSLYEEKGKDYHHLMHV